MQMLSRLQLFFQSGEQYILLRETTNGNVLSGRFLSTHISTENNSPEIYNPEKSPNC